MGLTGGDPTRLLDLLRERVEAAGWVSPQDVTRLAATLGLPRAHVEGVAGFYAFIPTAPTGQFRVLFSDHVTDRMQGALALRAQFCDAFHVGVGETTRDGLVSVGLTSCTGLCDQGPALMVNGRAIARLTPARIGAICALIRGRSPVTSWPDNLFTVTSHVERRDVLLSATVEPGEALAAAQAMGAQGVLEALRTSKLRGRGGAGYPTHQKWGACARAAGADRVVICNADEGEPGTFKDRELLRLQAELVLEGMSIAAFTVGASRGFLYLRAEYPFLRESLEAALATRRERQLLGPGARGAPGADFDIELRIGAGAYVCGEETALIESLEGRRGIPRIRPPFPVEHGYLGRPTVVDNVETLALAALVVLRGGAWFAGIGTASSTGTKTLSVAGDVRRPGIYEYPFGVTVRQLLDAAGAEDAQAVLVGGPSGTLLADHEFGRRIAFEDVPSAGAVTVFDASRDLVAAVANFADFFAHESCGFCTPCRVGTTLQRQIMSRLAAGRGSVRDLDDLHRIGRLMRATSQCGLGSTASNPVRDLLTKFRPAVEARFGSREPLPVFDLDESLAPAREATARQDAGAFLGEEG